MSLNLKQKEVARILWWCLNVLSHWCKISMMSFHVCCSICSILGSSSIIVYAVVQRLIWTPEVSVDLLYFTTLVTHSTHLLWLTSECVLRVFKRWVTTWPHFLSNAFTYVDERWEQTANTRRARHKHAAGKPWARSDPNSWVSLLSRL